MGTPQKQPYQQNGAGYYAGQQQMRGQGSVQGYAYQGQQGQGSQDYAYNSVYRGNGAVEQNTS